ncbi:MAG: ATP-binding protein [Gemmatimonadales bacterium]
MSFRARLLVAFGVAVVVPLLVFAAGVRREMDRRLTAEYRARVGAAVQMVRAQLDREGADVAGRLSALAAELPEDNRFRLGVQGDPSSRRYLLDLAGDAMRLSGLSFLEIQDSGGRVLSSGHFRNAYDRMEPALPLAVGSGGISILVRARTAAGSTVALARIDSFVVAGRRFTITGGTSADAFVGRLPHAEDLGVALALRGDSGSRAPDAVVGEVTLPYLDLAGGASTLDTARLVVTGSPATLELLRRSVTSWSLLAAATTGALALLLAAWLAARVNRPLAVLAEKTAAIDLDRLDQDFSSDRTDEIGALSRLLGAMTDRLRAGAARLREAERRVAMGDLARQVNHDIKNGLAPIRHVLRHLDDVARTDPAALAGVLAERKGTLDSSLAYLDTLARNYAGLSPALYREACDVNAVVEEIAAAVMGGRRLNTVLAAGLPPALTDRLVLRRILENLVGNAVDSVTDREGGMVTVTTEPSAEARVRITVADTGPGMSREQLDGAFDDFFTTKAGGTGLGLSIVRRLVLDLGGALRIVTEPGAGTRAIVDLPAAGEAPR